MRFYKKIKEKFIKRKTKTQSDYEIISNSKYFDRNFYMKNYQTLWSFEDPVEHYLHEGFLYGLNPSLKFSNDIYLSLNPDIFEVKMNPLFHFLSAGKKENRQYSEVLPPVKLPEKTNTKILLFSHELSYTGAPLVLLNVAKILKKNNIDCIVLSPKHGPLELEYLKNNIRCIVDINLLCRLYREDNNIIHFFNCFEKIFFNSIGTLEYIKYIGGNSKKICWIHEGEFGYKSASTIFDLKEAFKYVDDIYSVGEYSKSFTDKYSKNKSKILLYGVENNNINFADKKSNKLTFSVFGTICERKGQDLFIEAINSLPLFVRKNCIFKIVGFIGDSIFYNKLKNMCSDVIFTGGLSHEETLKEMSLADVIVCPSRDDPMPTVCTEAMLLKKPVICSTNTGTASFIKNGENSFIYDINKDKLKNIILNVYKNKNKLDVIGKNWNKVYEKFFKNEIFENNILDIFSDNIQIQKENLVICGAGGIKEFDIKKLSDNKVKKNIGYNSGNIIFAKYFCKHLSEYYNLIDYTSESDLNLDCALLLANFLRPTFDKTLSEKLLNYINKMNGSLKVISIGAQANLEDMNPKEYVKTLDDTVKQIAYKMSEKCISIGVRGEFSYDVLKELGIKNVDIIGCPSWFVNGYQQKDIVKKEWNDDFKVAFYTCWEPYSSWHQAWHRKLLNESLNLKDAKFVLQSEFEFLPYFFKNTLNIEQNYTNYRLSAMKLAEHFGISLNRVLFDNKIKNMVEIFTNIKEWEDFTKTRDLNFGFRIHGSIISLKQGVPALPIAPDSRISEFCDFFKIPYLKVNTISSEDFNLRKFYEEADFSAMNKVYPKLLKNYISFLNKNGIKNDFTEDQK